MENVNKQLLDALKSVTLSEEDIELERSVAPEEYDKARKLIANADAMIVKELKDIEESCHHKKPELFAMIQEYGAAEHSQNDGLAIHLLSKIKEAIAAAEQTQQAEPVGWWYEMAVELDADGVPTEWVPHVQIRKPATLHHTKNIRPLIYGDAAQPPAVATDAITDAMEANAWRAALRGLCTGRELMTPDECAEHVRHRIESAKSGTNRPAVAVPDGYALVPIEPTAQMVEAGFGRDDDNCKFWLHPAQAYRAMLAAAPQAADPIKRLIAMHNELLGEYPYCYFELAYTRRTDWMAWLCTKPREDDPERKVLACGQGLTAEKACAEAISAAQKGAQ